MTAGWLSRTFIPQGKALAVQTVQNHPVNLDSKSSQFSPSSMMIKAVLCPRHCSRCWWNTSEQKAGPLPSWSCLSWAAGWGNRNQTNRTELRKRMGKKEWEWGYFAQDNQGRRPWGGDLSTDLTRVRVWAMWDEGRVSGRSPGLDSCGQAGDRGWRRGGDDSTLHTPSELPEEVQIDSMCKAKPVEGFEGGGIIQLMFF